MAIRKGIYKHLTNVESYNILELDKNLKNIKEMIDTKEIQKILREIVEGQEIPEPSLKVVK